MQSFAKKEQNNREEEKNWENKFLENNNNVFISKN